MFGEFYTPAVMFHIGWWSREPESGAWWQAESVAQRIFEWVGVVGRLLEDTVQSFSSGLWPKDIGKDASFEHVKEAGFFDAFQERRCIGEYRLST